MLMIIFLAALILCVGLVAVSIISKEGNKDRAMPKEYLDASKYTSRLPHGMIVAESLEDDEAIMVKIRSNNPVYGFVGTAEQGIITPITATAVSFNTDNHVFVFTKCRNVLKEIKISNFKSVYVPKDPDSEKLCVINAPYKEFIEVFTIKTNVKKVDYLPNIKIPRQTVLSENIVGQNPVAKISKAIGTRPILSSHPTTLYDNKSNYMCEFKSQTITNIHDGITRFISAEIKLKEGYSMFVAYVKHKTLFSDLYLIDRDNNIIASKLNKGAEAPNGSNITPIHINEYKAVNDSKVRLVEDIYDVFSTNPTTSFSPFAVVCKNDII